MASLVQRGEHLVAEGRRLGDEQVELAVERQQLVLRPAAALDALLDADDHAAFCAHFGPFASRAAAPVIRSPAGRGTRTAVQPTVRAISSS